MSKFNQKVLVAALAMGIAGVAGAAEIQTNANSPGSYVFAKELTGAAAAASRTAVNDGVIGYAVKAGDNVVLRAQPVKVTVKATGGVITALAPTVAQGTLNASGVTLAAGEASFIIDGPTGNLFGTGSLFTIAAGGLGLNGLPTTEGGTVALAVTLTDPTTNAVLDTISGTVLTVKQATKVEATAAANPTRIDVSAAPARTLFVGGTVNNDLGVVEVGLNNFGTTASPMVASAAGSTVTANTNGTKFQLSTTASSEDQVELVVTAQQGTAFRPVVPAPVPAVATNAGASLTYKAAATGSPVLDTDCATAGLAFTPTATNTNEYKATVTLDADMVANGIRICAHANGVTPIDAQTFSVSSKIKIFNAARGWSPAAVTGTLATLTYNGTNEKVWHFNPASNANQTSYLRITNTSGIGGLVRISGIDDAGVKSPTEATFTLAKDKSILLLASDIEAGSTAKGVSGGLGTPTAGKWRLDITAELPNGTLKVQNFLRNKIGDAQINTNINLNN